MKHSPVVRLLRDLIALPSVNPSFLPQDHEWAGEGRVIELLEHQAGRAGLDCRQQDVLPGRFNLLVRLSPTGRTRRRILLAPHLDTVGGPPLDPILFQPRIRDDRLHGRGACDTKGCVAAYFQALLEVTQKGPRPAETEVIFAGLADEEWAQRGSRTLARKGPRADLAVVGEPTRLQVVTAHKGTIRLLLKTTGKAAHGSRPELGRNAILAMGRVVELLEKDYQRALSNRTHPRLRPPTINVGTIQGGFQANIVPDSCEIHVDRRTHPGETSARVEREIQVLLRKHGIRVTIQSTRDLPCDASDTDPNLPEVQRFMQGVGRRRATGADFFCDAAPLAAGGTPGIVFGPGDIAQAHTSDEWISLPSLEQAQARLVRYIRSLP